MLTRFNIFNRDKLMKGVKFSSNINCSLGQFGKTFGPYEFNLDLILQSGFNANTRTIIMIPGYLSDEEEPWVRYARETWLEIEDVNVIEVSWSDSNHCIYSSAVARTPLVARQITIFLYYLAELSGIRLNDAQFLDNIHIIGHSLGAHIAGFVGQDLAGRLGRITGLDPAGPSFDQLTNSQRLDRTDAQLVDVIHTNSGKLKYMNAFASAPLHALSRLPGVNDLSRVLSNSYSGEGDTAWYGIDANVGHIDYYANNGRVQPGCSGILHICDHVRAVDIYLKMLNYELNLRKSTNDTTTLKRSRLLAFKSDTYESFITGANFLTYCPEIIDMKAHLSERVATTFTRCSIPMDLITPTQELIDELKNDYNIDIGSPNKNEVNYYFKTNDQGHLVGDHYLLKLYFNRSLMWGGSQCTLEAMIDMSYSRSTLLEIDLAFDQANSYRPLSIPFIHSHGSRARETLNRILEIKERQDRDKEDIDLFLKGLLPDAIELNIAKPKSKTVFGTVKDLTIKMLKSDNDVSCSFDINMVEVQPINGYQKSFAGLYRPPVGEPTEVLTQEQLEKYEEEFMITLQPEMASSVRVELSAVAFG